MVLQKGGTDASPVCRQYKRGQFHKNNRKNMETPKIIHDILQEYLNQSPSPFAASWRQRQAALHPNTELCVDLKTHLLTPRRLHLCEARYGTLSRTAESRYEFTEALRTPRRSPARQLNPCIRRGKAVCIRRWSDSTPYPTFTRRHFQSLAEFQGFCLAAAEELIEAAGNIG